MVNGRCSRRGAPPKRPPLQILRRQHRWWWNRLFSVPYWERGADGADVGRDRRTAESMTRVRSSGCGEKGAGQERRRGKPRTVARKVRRGWSRHGVATREEGMVARRCSHAQKRTASPRQRRSNNGGARLLLPTVEQVGGARESVRQRGWLAAGGADTASRWRGVPSALFAGRSHRLGEQRMEPSSYPNSTLTSHLFFLYEKLMYLFNLNIQKYSGLQYFEIHPVLQMSPSRLGK